MLSQETVPWGHTRSCQAYNTEIHKIEVSDWITDLQKINTHKHLVMFTQLGLLIETCGVGGGGGVSPQPPPVCSIHLSDFDHSSVYFVLWATT